VTLARGGGDCDDHAILATSLLTGCGMMAWVAIGRGPTGPHAWVIGTDPLRGPFVLEPQGGKLWWGGSAPGYSIELALGPERSLFHQFHPQDPCGFLVYSIEASRGTDFERDRVCDLLPTIVVSDGVEGLGHVIPEPLHVSRQ